MSDHNTTTDILLAGAIAAFSVDLLVYPLDTLKTRLQSPDYSRVYYNAVTRTVNKPALFRGLYQGVGSVIIATLPSSGAFFTTYENVKAALTNKNPTLSSHSKPLIPQPLIHSASSAIAELVSCAILTPAEVIKQNAQMVRVAPGSSPAAATLQTLARFRHNPLGLWWGYTALAGRNLPFTALQFPMFEKLKETIKAHRDREGTRTGTLLEGGCITAISAGSAGSVAAVVTTPIDVIKTRIMLAAGQDSAHRRHVASDATANQVLVDALGKQPRHGQQEPIIYRQGNRGRRGNWAVAKEVIQEQGFKGLWRGGALRAVWTMVGSGLYLGAYESGRIWLASRRGEHIDEAQYF